MAKLPEKRIILKLYSVDIHEKDVQVVNDLFGSREIDVDNVFDTTIEGIITVTFFCSYVMALQLKKIALLSNLKLHPIEQNYIPPTANSTGYYEISLPCILPPRITSPKPLIQKLP